MIKGIYLKQINHSGIIQDGLIFNEILELFSENDWKVIIIIGNIIQNPNLLRVVCEIKFYFSSKCCFDCTTVMNGNLKIDFFELCMKFNLIIQL